MKKILLTCIMMLCVQGQAFSSSDSPIRTGTYTLEGKNDASSLNINYRGEVTIVPNEDTYSLIWKIGRGQCQLGTAILNEDILSVVYHDVSSSSFGVVSYKVMEDGVLEGKWAPFNAAGCGFETLKWKK